MTSFANITKIRIEVSQSLVEDCWVIDQGLRVDGRRAVELRNIKCNLGVLNEPDGSAYLEQGNSKVLVAVYGPHGVKDYTKTKPGIVNVTCRYSAATFAYSERKKRERDDSRHEMFVQQIINALKCSIKSDAYLNSQIDVIIEMIQIDGGKYCICVNAATMALIDAGISLKDYVVSCSLCMSNENNKLLLDTNNYEETSTFPLLTVAVLPRSEEILHLDVSRIHYDHLELMVKEAISACQQVYKILDKYVRSHVQHGTEWNARR